MTEEFKIGDHVEVVSIDGNDEDYYRVGAGGVIVATYSRILGVRFTYGDFTVDGGNVWCVLDNQIKKVVPYSSTFTEPVKAEAPSGHTADGGGLQKHSVGDIYPLCVVGYAFDADTTVWVVENLARGRVACGERKSVWQWDNYKDAAEFAEHAMWYTKDRMGRDILWEVGRPVFPKKPRIVLNTAQG